MKLMRKKNIIKLTMRKIIIKDPNSSFTLRRLTSQKYRSRKKAMKL